MLAWFIRRTRSVASLRRVKRGRSSRKYASERAGPWGAVSGAVDGGDVVAVERVDLAHRGPLAGQRDVVELHRVGPREGRAVLGEERARDVVVARRREQRRGVLALERLLHVHAGDDRAVVLPQDRLDLAAQASQRGDRHAPPPAAAQSMIARPRG
jgi:hypothetical protein